MAAPHRSTLLDWAAIRAGGSVALVFAVPLSFAARWFAENDGNSVVAAILSLLALVGFLLGSGVAAWAQQRDLPLKHGVSCALLTYALAQVLFIAVRLILGRDVHWFAAVFNLTAVVFVGLLGGFLGQILRRRGFLPRSSRGGQDPSDQVQSQQGWSGEDGRG